jgi:hypothetical protein
MRVYNGVRKCACPSVAASALKQTVCNLPNRGEFDTSRRKKKASAANWSNQLLDLENGSLNSNDDGLSRNAVQAASRVLPFSSFRRIGQMPVPSKAARRRWSLEKYCDAARREQIKMVRAPSKIRISASAPRTTASPQNSTSQQLMPDHAIAGPRRKRSGEFCST